MILTRFRNLINSDFAQSSFLNHEIAFMRSQLHKVDHEGLRDFISKNLHEDKSYLPREEILQLKGRREKFEAIKNCRSISTFRIKKEFPFKKSLEEAKALKHLFTDHRRDPNYGWKALCLHGSSPGHTNDFNMYGYKSREEANYQWTEIADRCPVTSDWFKENWPYSEFHRLRFVLLEPGGSITPHRDTDGERGFFAVNIALNQPFGCNMFMDQFGIVPWRPGDIRWMDIGNHHAVYNFSDEDRYHIIVHGLQGPRFEEFEDMIVNSL